MHSVPAEAHAGGGAPHPGPTLHLASASRMPYPLRAALLKFSVHPTAKVNLVRKLILIQSAREAKTPAVLRSFQVLPMLLVLAAHSLSQESGSQDHQCLHPSSTGPRALRTSVYTGRVDSLRVFGLSLFSCILAPPKQGLTGREKVLFECTPREEWTRVKEDKGTTSREEPIYSVLTRRCLFD